MFRRTFCRTKTLALAVAVIGVIVAATACGSGASTAPSSQTSGNTVQVSEREWSITVAGTELTNGNGDATIPAGTVTFNIKNVGTITHAFEIQGNGIEKRTGNIDVGTTAKLTVDLKPGTYEVFCPIPGHKQAGMDGHVTAS